MGTSGVAHNGGVSSPLEELPVGETTHRQLDFLLASHRLTSVYRLNRLLDGSRSESSAEHSWHLAVSPIALAADHAPGVDLATVVIMLLIHDLVEIDAGDVPIYDEQRRLDIVAEEHRAAVALFARLPPAQGAALLSLWREFEEAQTEAARFARAVDRLQPLLLHWASDGAAWGGRSVTVRQEPRLIAALADFLP